MRRGSRPLRHREGPLYPRAVAASSHWGRPVWGRPLAR